MCFVDLVMIDFWRGVLVNCVLHVLEYVIMCFVFFLCEVLGCVCDDVVCNCCD